MSKKNEIDAKDRDSPKIEYTVDEIKKAAYNWREFPPCELEMPERVLWLTLANIYKRFKDGELSKADGEQLTASAMRVYQNDRTLLCALRQIVNYQAEMWKRIEIVGNKYGTEPTIEAADAFFEAVYDVKIKQKGEKTYE